MEPVKNPRDGRSLGRSEAAMRSRQQSSPRDWIPQDTRATKSQAEHLLHVLEDTPLCSIPQTRFLRTREPVRGARRGRVISQFPERWSLELKAPNPNSLPIAETMVEIGGSAADEDRQAVIEHLAVFPPELLKFTRDAMRLGVIACRNSITDAWPELRGVTPRGWPEGVTWDTVPGTVNYERRRVIIATRGAPGGRTPSPDGHGSFNLVGHEFMHAFNFGHNRKGFAVDSRFLEARRRVMKRIKELSELPIPLDRLEYYRQKGTAGHQESHAESGCRWFYGDPLIRESELFEPIADFWRLIERELGIHENKL